MGNSGYNHLLNLRQCRFGKKEFPELKSGLEADCQQDNLVG